MARLTINTLATEHPAFRITVREVSGRRLYHVDHGPSRLGSACTITTLKGVDAVIRAFARDRGNTSYWRPECFLSTACEET